jgi:signal transduction histidine kinase/ActR/RegA family two-component response regulator
VGRRASELLLDGEPAPSLEQRHARRIAGEAERYEVQIRRKNGQQVWVEITGTPFRDPNGDVIGTLGALTDISERKMLQEQLLQSQKMDAVGRLAGGVAHDFNNLLTAIKGFTELLLLDFDPADSRHPFITEIQAAANRAASLTRQLLAFSRKQVLQPRVLDLNASVVDMEKMLRRLIGEDVTLDTALDVEPKHVKADPGQIEQVILNLAVNARDAMPHGGRITVATSTLQLAAEQIPRHAGVEPGPYVALTVSDTGTGIDEITRGRIFEPFYTTKEQGKGTGLGLSTVYGIVQQSGGFIELESEPGAGTTFRILLPQVEEEVERTVRHAPTGTMDGSETVLMVEDEIAVRVLVRRVLDRAGYHVLEAASGAEALDLVETTDLPIDILLTDVVMPGMSGRELADELCARFPTLRVLFMSGYTDEAIVHHGVLEAGVSFMEKPFTPEILLQRLREALDVHITR